MDLDRDILPELKKSSWMTKDTFSSARKLALYPENRETLSLCHFFAERTTDVLEELIIHANFDMHDQHDHSVHATPTLDNRQINDSATAPGLMTSTIFSHMMPFEKCTPFKNLNSLRLHKVSLRHCADTWCKLVNFKQLHHLRIYQCSGADSLLGQMCKASSLPMQLKTLEFQHKDNAENEALVALDGFLCLAQGVKDLVIDMENVQALPAAAGISKHGKTLELLNVHCSREPTSTLSPGGESDELVWDIDDFEKICKACKQLEQLSCAWPATSLIRAPSDEWKGYENMLKEHLRGLVTLHVSSWPTNKPSTQLLPRSIYEQLMQGLAQRIFELTADVLVQREAALVGEGVVGEDTPSMLRLVAFGISDKIYEREDSTNQIIYLRSTSLDCVGKEKVYATPIGWCLRQYVEPRSEVLDFVLHREARLPYGEREVPWGIEDDE